MASLDLTANTNLYAVNCGHNPLTVLNLKNGNNTNIGVFDASNNPDLNCIQVDDAAWSTSHWTYIDPWASFNTNCAYGINEVSESSISSYPNPVINNLTIESKGNVAIEILNSEGQTIKEFKTAENKLIVYLSDLSSGIYLLKATNDKGIIIRKFIKE